MPKIALLTGIAGMDGSYLADLLVNKQYDVHGIIRRHSQPNHINIQHLLAKDAITLHEADLSDKGSLERVIATVGPDEVYNLGAQSHVGTSFQQPEVTNDITGQGAVRLFQATAEHAPQARIYQASSSEMFGNTLTFNPDFDQSLDKLMEGSPLAPVSPYGAAKVFAHHSAHIARANGQYVACGILFNHEGPRRGPQFVTRKITRALTRIKHGLQKKLILGNLDAIRDWGYAPEYCEAMWRMLQQANPTDYVIATGMGHSVMEFLMAAHQRNGWTWDHDRLPDYLELHTTQRRPTDIHKLVGDHSKATRDLNWRPKTMFQELVTLMVEHDEAIAETEASHLAHA